MDGTSEPKLSEVCYAGNLELAGLLKSHSTLVALHFSVVTGVLSVDGTSEWHPGRAVND